MAKINTPVDHMFRAGQISSKEWSRLSMTANGKGGKTKGRMAKFDDKAKGGEGGTSVKSVAATKPGHIDGPEQGKAAKAAFTAPTKGGGVHGNAGVAGHIDSHQKPNFPRQGGGKARKTLSRQQPMRTNPSGPPYGGPNSRP